MKVKSFHSFHSRSSKNRRKAEHKKWKLKEGSQYEDIALIAALSRLIRTVDDLRGQFLGQALIAALSRLIRTVDDLRGQFLGQVVYWYEDQDKDSNLTFSCLY